IHSIQLPLLVQNIYRSIAGTYQNQLILCPYRDLFQPVRSVGLGNPQYIVTQYLNWSTKNFAKRGAFQWQSGFINFNSLQWDFPDQKYFAGIRINCQVIVESEAFCKGPHLICGMKIIIGIDTRTAK